MRSSAAVRLRPVGFEGNAVQRADSRVGVARNMGWEPQAAGFSPVSSRTFDIGGPSLTMPLVAAQATLASVPRQVEPRSRSLPPEADRLLPT